MSAQILDGKALAIKLKDLLIEEITSLKAKYKRTPKIVSIVIGDDPANKSYITSQKNTAESLGIQYELRRLPADISQAKLITDVIVPSNDDKDVHGIIINKPVPSHIDFELSFISIDLYKNIECLNSCQLGELIIGNPRCVPCTPAAALALLKSTGVSLSGKTAVVIGRSETVGKPLALLLIQENMTVTVCHSKTMDLEEHVRRADVVVAAVGKPLFVKSEWIKEGAIVIDVGINSYEGRIVGDVDFEDCKRKAAFIAPVPGGVGPVTSVMLMKNTVEAFKKQL